MGNLNSALKRKNVLANDVKTQLELLQEQNTYKVRNESFQEYDTKQILNATLDNINRLVETKAAIARANQEVWPKIFRMAELKGLVQTLKTVPVKRGVELESTGYGAEAKTVEWKSTLTHTDIEHAVKEYEDEIQRLQDDLDKFNFTTEVKI